MDENIIKITLCKISHRSQKVGDTSIECRRGVIEPLGQTERVNRVLEEILRGYVQSYRNCSEFLPMFEFAINNSVHASTTHTPFFVNGLRHPRLPAHLECDSGYRGLGDSQR